ncbi:hypothetical protein DVDV_3344 [Desulfovibrio sp. DV]|nr:hypothetical protein DVDV_3344 [Desulfovibrio sp. DV]
MSAISDDAAHRLASWRALGASRLSAGRANRPPWPVAVPCRALTSFSPAWRVMQPDGCGPWFQPFRGTF